MIDGNSRQFVLGTLLILNVSPKSGLVSLTLLLKLSNRDKTFNNFRVIAELFFIVNCVLGVETFSRITFSSGFF